VRVIQFFDLTLPCLGSFQYGLPHGGTVTKDYLVQVTHRLGWNRAGKFSYHGPSVAPGTPLTPTVDFSGQFTSDSS
jgi:hypothetical protein